MLRIGIDTGGTYTDAVIYHPKRGVIAAAKARTRQNLSLGLSESLNAVLEQAQVSVAEISLVCVSTTLATNALVEGAGGRAALFFIGFDDKDQTNRDLKNTVADAPLIPVIGGHDANGVEVAPLDTTNLIQRAEALENIDAFAITARFSVRNPAHELAAASALERFGLPIACGHQLTAKLNGPRRALTCLLNARLMTMIDQLCSATETSISELGIQAPLMMVKGDGSLVSAKVVRQRPIETILSGPAASLIGAGHLVGQPDVVVSDIGGTTTDIGVLRSGFPAVSESGATIGGHRTMVSAVEVFTHGLGGDSEVQINDTSDPVTLKLGPRRVVPLSLASAEDPSGLINRTLATRTWPFRLNDTRFVRTSGQGGQPTSERAEDLYRRITSEWQPWDKVITRGLQVSALNSLIAHRQVEMAGFTPTDAAHVLGLHDMFDTQAATLGADILASLGDMRGDPIAADGVEFAKWVKDSVVRNSAEVVLAACLDQDGLDPALATTPLAVNAFDQRLAVDGFNRQSSEPNTVKIGLSVAKPLIGLGASANTYYPEVGSLLNVETVLSEHGGVANAIGAAVGSVRVTAQATITQPSKGKYRIHITQVEDRYDLQPAIDDAFDALEEQVYSQAMQAGAAKISIQRDVKIRSALIESKDFFVEATVTVVATGPPNLEP